MKSLVIKRSVVLDGHKTSVSLEDAFWSDLKEIARMQRATLSKLITEIDKDRQGNLSSAIRVFVFDQVRAQGDLWRCSAPDGLRKKPNFKPWRKITNYDRVNDGRKLSAIAASAKHDVTIARCQDHVTFLLTKNNYWNLRQPRRAQSPPVNINYGKAALRAFHACIRAIVFSLRFVRGAF